MSRWPSAPPGRCWPTCQQTQFNSLRQITTLVTYSMTRFMSLDAQTRRNLELVESSSRAGGPTLFTTLNETRTPLGARLLRHGSASRCSIGPRSSARYDGVEWFVREPLLRAKAA